LDDGYIAWQTAEGKSDSIVINGTESGSVRQLIELHLL